MARAIESENLTKKFDRLVAVDRLSINIEPGEIFGLVGPDGSGKTTTIRLLSTAMEQSSGSAKILGLDISKDEEKIRERIGYLPQQFSLYGDLTVEENIDFFADIYNIEKNIREKKKEELLKFIDLSSFKKRRAQFLSGGMKKKLALACSLIHKPEVLFLDEPTTGVDPISRREFWKILHGLPSLTILVATPYMDEAERCNRVGLLNEGKLLICNSPAEIKKKGGTKSLEEAYITLIMKNREKQ
ncbi:MAG: ABC transporter ATP-binding protein [Candidatus Saganbacteria bacterium]|nr:ABC transporter ATP-binding protein [Candidatus Saganbacteria bacterium]